MLQPQPLTVPEPMRKFHVSDVEWLQTIYPWLAQYPNWWVELRFTEDRADGLKSPPVSVRFLRDVATIVTHLRDHRALSEQRATELRQSGSGPRPAGLFWGIQPRVAPRGGREQVAAFVALAASTNCDDWEVWPQKERPRVAWEALHACPQTPSVILWTGHGFDALWLLREPLFDRRRGEDLQQAIAHCLQANAQDAASLFRWPQSVNYERLPRQRASLVRIVWWQPQTRFSFDKLREQFLPYIHPSAAGGDAATKWKRFLRQLPPSLRGMWGTYSSGIFSTKDQHTLNLVLASTLLVHDLGWSDFETIAPLAPWNAASAPTATVLEAIWREVRGTPRDCAVPPLPPLTSTVEIQPLIALAPAVSPPSPELFLATLPESAWTEWARLYRTAVGACTEAADEFHYMALLTVLGTAFGRSVVIQCARPVYLNMYTVLVGPTGDRKSTAAQLALDLLARAAPQTLLLNGIGSQEGLMERMAADPSSGQHRTLWFVDEMASLLKKARRESSGSLIEFVTEIFHCPDFKTHFTRSKAIHLQLPTLSILAGSTPTWLEAALQQEDILGGFANRFVYVTGQLKPDNPMPRRPDSQALDELVAWIRRATQGPDREIGWSEGARELWSDFYLKWRPWCAAKNEQVAALLRRIDLYILKFAAMSAAMNGVAKISSDHLTAAIELGRFLAGCAVRVLGELGAPSDCRLEALIERKLQEAHGQMRRKQLRQALGGRISGEKLDRMLTCMERNGLIKQINDTAAHGASRLVQLT